MKVLLVEDEPLAQEKLKDLVLQYDPSIEIAAILDSVTDATEFLKKHPNTDLVFMDIQLSDGICFEIFKNIQVDQPVIFTTAYDQYALEAFKTNSIDYLLKPISYSELEAALLKYQKLRPGLPSFDPDVLRDMVMGIKKSDFKQRFLIKVGNSMQFIAASDIAYFLADDKTVYLTPQHKKDRFIVDHTLEELEKLLDPNEFYRINRKFIIRIDSIKAIHTYFNSRLILELNAPCDLDIIISRERVSDFKNWLNT
jgi:DNA-binding LytR/AlgR family response regulator